MDKLLLSFGTVKLEWQSVLLSFLFALVLSSIVAIVYERTFRGLSWSRGLMESMILGSLITCLLMIAIGDNVARGIGIVGSLAVIRFRTNLRDPRDLVFLFAALGSGVAAGVQSYIAGMIGIGVFCLVAIGMNVSVFGDKRRHDGIVRFQAPSDHETSEIISGILKGAAKSFVLVTMRQVAQGDLVDCAYQVKLAGDGDSVRLIRELEKVKGIRGLAFMSQQSTVEV